MNSLSIHGLDHNLLNLIQTRAKSAGISINKEVKLLLQSALGIKPIIDDSRHNDFKEFLGVWSAEDFADFQAASKDFEQIDKSDWQ